MMFVQGSGVMKPIDKIVARTFDEDVMTAAAVVEKLFDAFIPGFVAEFAPDEAELAGAFLEAALSEGDALDSAIDLENTIVRRNGAGRE
jgi:hypothetical protein